jgi:hypothetical protein
VSCSTGLAGARPEGGRVRRELSDLLQSASRAAAEVSGRAEAVSVHVECAPCLPSGRDPVVLGRLVRNLVLNAIEASPDGAQVLVEATGADDRTTLHVRDRGRGMPAGEIERWYTRAGSGGRGSGLGSLSVLDAVVRVRGSLVVESHLGSGTSVRLCFPACVAELELLLVDPWSVRRSARAARLEQSGALVRAAADPAEALAELDGDVARLLVARGVTGSGLALLLERARTLGVPLEWLGAGDSSEHPA